MSRALTFRGLPGYVDVVNALAVLPPGDLTQIHLSLEPRQWQRIADELHHCDPNVHFRTHLCGVPLEVGHVAQ